jgi:hypothetical protein
MRKFIIALPILALAGCGGNTAPIQTTYDNSTAAAETALTGAEKAATNYVTLPLCVSGGPIICSNAAISAQIKAADNIAVADLAKLKAGSVAVSVVLADIAALTAAVPATPAAQ